ncbi:hypothetical protein ACVWZK_005196 [Bradyrhizobium sp. GM0.4]
MRVTRSSEAKANGARLLRPDRRHLGNVLVDRHKRRHHPRIFLRLAPAGKRQPSRRLQRAAEIGERRDGIGEEHHAEPRGQQVKARRLERMHRRIGQHEIERQAFWRKRARLRQHRLGDVEPERKAIRRDILRERERRRTGATADVEDALARLRPGAGDQHVGNGSQQALLRRMAIGPALPAGAIPVGDLIGVLLVSAWLLHQGLCGSVSPACAYRLRRGSLRSLRANNV